MLPKLLFQPYGGLVVLTVWKIWPSSLYYFMIQLSSTFNQLSKLLGLSVLCPWLWIIWRRWWMQNLYKVINEGRIRLYLALYQVKTLDNLIVLWICKYSYSLNWHYIIPCLDAPNYFWLWRVRYNMNYRHIFDALSLVFFPLLKKVNCMLDLNHGPLNVSASIGDA